MNTLWSTLCCLLQYRFDDLARWFGQLRIPNLLAGYHAAVNSLCQRLPDEVSLNLAELDQIENRSERTSACKPVS